MAKFNTQHLVQSIKFIPAEELNKHEILFLFALISYGNIENKIYVSHESLSKMTKISTKGFQRATVSLVQKGYLSVIKPLHYTHKTCNIYTLNLEKIYSFNPLKSVDKITKSLDKTTHVAGQNTSSHWTKRSMSVDTVTDLDRIKTVGRSDTSLLPTGNATAAFAEREQNQKQDQPEEDRRTWFVKMYMKRDGMTEEEANQKIDNDIKNSPYYKNANKV